MSGVSLQSLGFRQSRMVLAAVLLAVYLTFSMGAVTGANAALDTSTQAPPDMSELDSINPEIKEQIRDDLPAPVASIYISLASGLVRTLIWFGKFGAGLGYQFPRGAQLNGVVGPIVMMGLSAVMIKRRATAILGVGQ